MDADVKRPPKDKQSDVQLAFEAINDWHTENDMADMRRPWYFSALIFSWFSTVATGLEFSRNYLIWLIGHLGIVGIWFGAISFFLLYANTFRQKRQLEKLIKESRAELRAIGLKYVRTPDKKDGTLLSIDSKQPFDPYDDDQFA